MSSWWFVSRGMLLGAAALPAVLFLVVIWSPDAEGLIPGLRKLPAWDFTNLWAGGTLAREGQLGTLFDADSYREWLRARFSPRLADSEWSYPPSMLLLGIPLSALPLLHSYLLWTGGSLAVLVGLLRLGGVGVSAALLVLASPAALQNITYGQNGALTAALLCGGLMLAPRKPVLSGVLFGLLTVKPQLGILVPICLLASRNHISILAAALTAAALAAATGLTLGPEAWTLFLSETRPLMQSILEAPWPGPGQSNAVTVFALARSVGLSVPLAYLVQAGAAMGAAILAWRAWRDPQVDPDLRMALTVFLTFLATPYAYSYDMVSCAVALAVMLRHGGWRPTPLLFVGWAWPGINRPVLLLFYPLAPLLLAGLAWQAWRALQGARGPATSWDTALRTTQAR